MTTWIVGPCSIETREAFLSIIPVLSSIMEGRDWYYKASFDKANRSAVDGRRGPGFEAGLDIFRECKKQHPNVRLITDVHECWQVEPLENIVDCIQVPAFLCRQTDLLIECGRNFSKINIKKGQWLSPLNIMGAADKVRSVNPNAEVWLCERGTQFGYDRLVVDFRNVGEFLKAFDKVIIDCTHSTQVSKADGRTGGDRLLAERYLLSASIFGYTGIFAEVHPNPSQAISDADSQLELRRFEELVELYDSISGVAERV